MPLSMLLKFCESLPGKLKSPPAVKLEIVPSIVTRPVNPALDFEILS